MSPGAAQTHCQHPASPHTPGARASQLCNSSPHGTLQARCKETHDSGNQPCRLNVVAASVAAKLPVAANYKDTKYCPEEGQPCRGMFNMGGECCSGYICTFDVPSDRRGPTGMCRRQCGVKFQTCASDSECCQYWGTFVCDPDRGLCLPPNYNWND